MPNEILSHKVKFNSAIPDGSTLLYGISKDNLKQSGKNFQFFTNWIIENKKKVVELKIILSDWLNRFYVGKEEALLWGNKWKENNQEYLDKLSKANITCQVINWREVVETEDYKNLKLDIDALYRSDEGFRMIVEGLAKSHQHKAGFMAAIDYVLEESAVLASLREGIITYPSHELNGAVHYTLKKLNCDLHFIGHMLIPANSSSDPQISLYQTTFKTMCALDKAKYKSAQDKMNFFIRAINTYEKTKKPNLFVKELSLLQKPHKKPFLDEHLFYKKGTVKEIIALYEVSSMALKH